MTDSQSIVYVPDITDAPVGVPAQLNGAQLFFGTSPPNGATGVDGSYYMDVAAYVIYGPRAAGLWAAGTSFRGASGGTLALTAGAQLPLHRSLMFGGDGRAILADPTTANYVWAGLAAAAAVTDTPVQAIRAGLVTDPAWSWTPLGSLFADVAGQLVQVPPTTGAYHRIGSAVSATAILLAPEPVVSRP